MNIKEAKEQIKNAMTAYFTKDEFGNYCIPIEQQRPIFMMGPPGIGKTAVMEQVASELGVGLISYSMTHHTRQSALGLPFIVKKTYGGKEYDVSEYTMSEIIAAVYDMIEETGKTEGILFLDEINCVSETLAPAMLQFLQYKIFGRHAVPKGWLVVTAGNPPEYNNSVREFDIVTWDRLKRVDVEPDFDVWKEYAYKKGVHPSIITFLEIKKDFFYKIETTVDGKSFVTARGWSDLSDMIRLYEQNKLTVDEKLISQYLQNKRIAKEFAIYYDLFNKYKSDYQVDSILAGKAGADIQSRAQSAKFDERLSLLGMLLDAVTAELKQVMNTEEMLMKLMEHLKKYKIAIGRPGADARELLSAQIADAEEELARGIRSSSLSADGQYASRRVIAQLNELLEKISMDARGSEMTVVKDTFANGTKKLKAAADAAGKKLSNAFRFCENTFGDGQELLILVTELTINYYAARFISRYGCAEYFAHNKELLFYERQKDLIREIDSLDEL